MTDTSLVVADTSLVVADIGGTHARFARARVADGVVRAIDDPVTLATADYSDFAAAWRDYAHRAAAPPPPRLALALAAPITRHDPLVMTNGGWRLDRAALARALGLDRLLVVNDFAAVAHAVAALGPAALRPVCGPDTGPDTGPASWPDDGPISVIGPGTGLGVALLLQTRAGPQVLATEGAHGAFAPVDALEARVRARLARRFDRVSDERLVAGAGLRAFADQLAKDRGQPAPPGDDTALWRAALADTDAKADTLPAAALAAWCRALGSVAGDIALAHGPGAVVIAGGIGRRLGDRLAASGFAERFVAKGRYRDVMADVPVRWLDHPEPGLYGAAAAFARLLQEDAAA